MRLLQSELHTRLRGRSRLEGNRHEEVATLARALTLCPRIGDIGSGATALESKARSHTYQLQIIAKATHILAAFAVGIEDEGVVPLLRADRPSLEAHTPKAHLPAYRQFALPPSGDRMTSLHVSTIVQI
jgi:hypothetical protein